MHAEQPHPEVGWTGPYLICPMCGESNSVIHFSFFVACMETYHKNGKVGQVEALALNIRSNLIALTHICNTSISSPVAFTTYMDWDREYI